MARPRIRYCPVGHDKDLAGGCYWHIVYTVKGTSTMQRTCAECQKIRGRVKDGRKRTEDMGAVLSAQHVRELRTLPA